VIGSQVSLVVPQQPLDPQHAASVAAIEPSATRFATAP
jgi:hypothetical protein